MPSDATIVSLPPDTTIHALLRLLSDPNEQVARTIQDQLARLGPGVLPFLEKAWTEDADLEPRVAYIKDEIRFGQLKDEFQTFVSHSARQEDWEHGAFLIAKLAYPDLSIPHYVECLDHWQRNFAPNGLPQNPRREKRHANSARFSLKTKDFRETGRSITIRITAI